MLQPSRATPAGDVSNAALKAGNNSMNLRWHCVLVNPYVVSEAVMCHVVRQENTVDILGVGNERFWAQGRPLWHATNETDDIGYGVCDVNCLSPVW